MAYVTKHATQRIKERAGLPKGVAVKNAERALRDGLRPEKTGGSLFRYLEKLYWKHQTADNIRVYCNNVYIFHGNLLITIFPLPPKYRKTADRLRKELKQRDR